MANPNYESVAIKSFYQKTGNDKKIDPELFDKRAEAIAKTFATVRKEIVNGREKEFRDGVTSTQIRRLFNEVKRYDRLLEGDAKEKWDKYFPYIKMIKSKVQYTIARSKKSDRKNGVYYDNLGKFLNEGISLVNDIEDFRIFISLFEAVYGYYYENRPDKNN